MFLPKPLNAPNYEPLMFKFTFLWDWSLDAGTSFLPAELYGLPAPFPL